MTKTAKNKEKMPELLTLKEASAILKCHPNTLRHWDNKGILPAIRIGIKRIRKYRKENILKLIQENTT